MNDDEFYIDDDDLNSDFELNAFEKEKFNVLSVIRETVDKIEENIKFRETSEEQKNFEILAGYVSCFIEINNLAKGNLPQAEALGRLKNIESAVKELNFDDIDDGGIEEDEGIVHGIDLLDDGSSENDFDF